MNKEFLNSVELTNKLFALSFLLLVFTLTTCFVIITILLSYRQCRKMRKSKSHREDRQRKPTPEFVRWVQKSLSGRKIVRRAKSGASIFKNSRFDATLRHEGDANRWAEATFQEDNVLEDLEFYEIRSEVDSLDFGRDLASKLKWEEAIKAEVLRAPSVQRVYPTINRKLHWHSNVRRNLLDEFTYNPPNERPKIFQDSVIYV